jgi:hypothetical protein
MSQLFLSNSAYGCQIYLIFGLLLVWQCLNRLDARDPGRYEVVQVIGRQYSRHGERASHRSAEGKEGDDFGNATNSQVLCPGGFISNRMRSSLKWGKKENNSSPRLGQTRRCMKKVANPPSPAAAQTKTLWIRNDVWEHLISYWTESTALPPLALVLQYLFRTRLEPSKSSAKHRRLSLDLRP